METFKILIEIPKGTVNNKFEYDHKTKTMVLDFVFENFVWPFNYGEMVGTLGGDGDALDAIVFSTEPLAQSAIAECIPFGVALMLDRGEVDDKLLFVPKGDKLAEKYKDINDFSAEERKNLENLYTEIARQKKKIIVQKGYGDKQSALELIEKSMV